MATLRLSIPDDSLVLKLEVAYRSFSAPQPPLSHAGRGKQESIEIARYDGRSALGRFLFCGAIVGTFVFGGHSERQPCDRQASLPRSCMHAPHARDNAGPHQCGYTRQHRRQLEVAMGTAYTTSS